MSATFPDDGEFGEDVFSDDFQLPDDFVIPDDLSGLDPTTLTEKAKRELAILVTRVAFPSALAGACALAGIEADVVGTEAGAVAMLRQIDDEAPEQAATAITQVVRGVPALLVTKSEGQISVSQFLDGKDTGPLPPAVVLTSAAEIVEELIVGAIKPDEVPGVVSSVGIGKVKALRMISEAAKPPRGHSFRPGRAPREFGRDAGQPGRHHRRGHHGGGSDQPGGDGPGFDGGPANPDAI